MLTKQLKVMGQIYSVGMNNSIQTMGAQGTCCGNTLEIYIDESSPPSVQVAALVHEALHAIDYCLAHDMDHNKLTAFASALYQVLVDNPEFLADIINSIEEVKDAKTVRSNARQVHARGSERRRGTGKGGKNIQRKTKEKPKNGKTVDKAQTGVGGYRTPQNGRSLLISEMLKKFDRRLG